MKNKILIAMLALSLAACKKDIEKPMEETGAVYSYVIQVKDGGAKDTSSIIRIK